MIEKILEKTLYPIIDFVVWLLEQDTQAANAAIFVLFLTLAAIFVLFLTIAAAALIVYVLTLPYMWTLPIVILGIIFGGQIHEYRKRK